MPACGGIKEALSAVTRASRRIAAGGGSAACPPPRIILSNTRQMQSGGFRIVKTFYTDYCDLFYAVFSLVLWCILRLPKDSGEKRDAVSQLRLIRTAQDAIAYRKIMLARYYHDQPLIFLTLTFKEVLEKKGKRNPYKLKLQALMSFLREKWSVEYLCVQTGEGQQVFHLALICPYIHHTVIRTWWRENTGAWNIHISREKSLPAFLSEMTGQYQTSRYSMSQNYIPKGSLSGLKDLKQRFSGKTLNRACMMYGRRLHDSTIDESVLRTCTCLERSYGICSDLRTKTVYLVGKTN